MGNSVQRAVYKDPVLRLPMLLSRQLEANGNLRSKRDKLLERGRWGRSTTAPAPGELSQFCSAHSWRFSASRLRAGPVRGQQRGGAAGGERAWMWASQTLALGPFQVWPGLPEELPERSGEAEMEASFLYLGRGQQAQLPCA